MNDNENMIERWLEKQGYRLVDDEYRQRIQEFRDWFCGYVPDFHDYRVRAVKVQKKLKRYSLGMAKTVAEDYATLLLNEKVQITSDQFKALGNLLRDNRFYERGNRLVEWTMALGTGALVEFADSDGKPTIDYIRGELIYPLNWDGDNITECAFGSRRVLGAKKDAGKGYYVQVHERRGGEYAIRNVWLNEKGDELPTPEGVSPESVSPVPLFQIIRPNIVNSIDPDSPMGMSVYGSAIDQLKAVDLVYDSYVNEFQLGKKRLLVPQTFAQQQMQEDGTMRPVFDANDLIYQVYTVSAGDKDKLTPVDMTLRAAEHEAGLQRMIDLLSKKCGLGTGRYRFEAGKVERTAQEVISDDSDLYQSVKRNEKPLERALIGMVKALGWLSGGSPDIDVGVEFDDSIFEDTGTTIERNIKLVAAGLKSKKAAIMEIAHCSDQEAEKRLREIASEQMIEPANVDGLFDKGERANAAQT